MDTFSWVVEDFAANDDGWVSKGVTSKVLSKWRGFFHVLSVIHSIPITFASR